MGRGYVEIILVLRGKFSDGGMRAVSYGWGQRGFIEVRIFELYWSELSKGVIFQVVEIV